MGFFQEYRKSLKRVEVEEVADLVLYRPLAFLFVKAVYRTSLTPNQITGLSMLAGLAAGVCFAVGQPTTATVGAGLWALALVLDCADGQLARLKKNGTRLGRALDGLVDYVTGVSAYVGISIGLKPAGWTAGRWWLLMTIAAASNIFHSMAFDYYRTRFLNVVQGFPENEDEDFRDFTSELRTLRASGRKSFGRFVIGIYVAYLNLQRRTTVRWDADSPLRRIPIDRFRRANTVIQRFWTMLGPSFAITLIIAAVLFRRFDWIFWGMIVVLNGVAAVLYLVQALIDRRLERRSSS